MKKSRVIIFMGLIVSLSIGNILSPIKVFSNKENRYLQELPILSFKDIISGKFTQDFETYTIDQFVFRDNWISLKTLGDLSLLKKDNGRIYFGKDDYLFDIDKEIDEKQLDENIKSINKFLETMSKHNIPVTSLLVPSKSTVLEEKLPLYAPTIDEEYIADKLESSLNKNIELIDLIEVLNGKSNGIYYKTDHHWTSKGAFYAYEYYMKQIGKQPLKEEDFLIEKAADDFYGTNYRKANFYLGLPDEIYIYNSKNIVEYNMKVNDKDEGNSLYDEKYLNKTDKYSYFLGGDKSLIEIKTSIKNNKTILIFKDSFGNSFIPFLTNHYENIIVIDTRYFNMNINDFIEGRDIDEVLFLFNIKNFAEEKSLFKLGK